MNNATNWTLAPFFATLWTNSVYIPLLGVLMGDPVYLMGDPVATMGDGQINPLNGAPTNWTPE